MAKQKQVTLTQLRSFVAVARQGSFTRAAETLGMSQPSVTAAIQQLEQTLGLTLFDRSTKTLRLAAASRSFLPAMERVLNDMDTTLSGVQSIVEGQSGHVAVAVLPSVATRILPETIKGYSKAFPGIRLALRDDNSFGICEKVANGEVDIGVAGRTDQVMGLEFEPIIRDPFGVAMHRSHPMASEQGPVRWQELAAYPFISFASDTGIRPILDSLDPVPENISVPWVEVSNIATVLSLLKANQGISALPQMSVDPRDRDIAFRILIDPPKFRELGLVTRKGRSLPPAAQKFVDYMKAALRPYWERGPGS
ncbi:LysR family transcriptional regulator [Roseobacter sp. HKCCD9010]|uniref:LysR family transcriptional regulator n=1 Tax=unclassified Roseobacter TaxID=196798 RepID=UPI0014920896|nr:MULTISPECIES: LysR family transcriptional regulator [unclassified Roseobacter]MBF9051961.1 LysR family transcriptional regulator [Rhodobacterales bacterium HKCCD4356]NNV10306.1 LysR family transcriptional regulator [Roseobacter sp. HKCCD7357]NNV18126.1 LysR family transcriptional regulator [Roseobacter sp. HKCCD8768]NNV27586.1 LysR family transcriptional regulator [Roseobacter sp. HKCCD8192]NNV31852.1 LysR family transcriptional regulator [Roseobacter sp. HKCCD9061]